MKRFFLIAVTLLITLNVAAFSWDPVPACQPMFLRVSYGSSDTAHTMAVTWNTKTECQTEIMYGEAGYTQQSVKGTHFKANEGLGYVHEVHLTGLKPESLYDYKVGNGTEWSMPHTFKTGSLPDSCSPVVFAVASDSRIENIIGGEPNKWANIVNEVFSHPDISFLFNGGDIVYDGDDISQWQDFMNTTPAHIADKPLMVALGNHDTGPVDGDDANYNQLFAYPTNSVTNSEDSYYFRYGPVLIVSLSTATFKDDFEATAQWMSSVFEKEKDAQWRIVFNHHPFYSSAGAGTNANLGIAHPPNEVGNDPVFIPVFDKYHVDLVISAHSHYYERFAPSYGYTPQDDTKDIEPNVVDSPDKGTIYMVSGGGGAMTFQGWLVDIMCGTGAIAGSQACGGENHFLLFRIENNVLHMETWNTSQQLNGVDPTEHKIVDTLDITKPYRECTSYSEEPDEDTVVDDDNETPDEDSAVETPDESEDIVETPDESETVDDTPVVDDKPELNDSDQTTDDNQNIPKQTKSDGCSILAL